MRALCSTTPARSTCWRASTAKPWAAKKGSAVRLTWAFKRVIPRCAACAWRCAISARATPWPANAGATKNMLMVQRRPGGELFGGVVLASKAMHRGMKNGAQRGFVARAEVADVEGRHGERTAEKKGRDGATAQRSGEISARRHAQPARCIFVARVVDLAQHGLHV